MIQEKKVNKVKRLLEGVMIILLTFFLLFVVLEVGVRVGVAIKILPDVPRITPEIYKIPYQNAPFDVDLFLREQYGAYNISYDETNGLWLPEESFGELVSHAKGFRTTLYQPESHQASIYLFGGSTLYSTNTPDAWTIPSQLQKIINQSGFAEYRVVNVGLSGYAVAQQNLRLQQLTLKDGDIIIYYDGTNNIFMNTSFSTLRANNLQEVLQSRLETAEWLGKVQKRTVWLLESLANFSRFSHYLQTFRWDLLFSPIREEAYQQSLIDRSVEIYETDINYAIDYLDSQQADVTFIHILQPTLYSMADPQGHEVTLLASYGTDYTYRKNYQAFKDLATTWRAEGMNAFELSSALDGESGVYFDFCHVNHHANQLIADEIFSILQPWLVASLQP